MKRNPIAESRESRALGLIACLTAAWLIAMPAPAAEIEIEWDAPTVRVDGTPLSDPIRYRVYYGTESSNYTAVVDGQPSSTAHITGLEEGRTYYFAVAAVDATGIEGPLSPELGWNSLDEDVDGLPDAWEEATLGSTELGDGTLASDQDRDGLSDIEEFIVGSDPAKEDGGARILVIGTSDGLRLAFDSRAAQGPGYERFRRAYAVETAVAADAPWSLLPGADRIPATGERIELAFAAAPSAVYRLRCWLESVP